MRDAGGAATCREVGLTDSERQDGGGRQEEDAEGEGAVEDQGVQARRVDQLGVVDGEHCDQPRPGQAACCVRERTGPEIAACLRSPAVPAAARL